jgi:hypothetical protein
MQNGKALTPIPSRPWRIIAKELSIETNPNRIAELSQELNLALEDQFGKLSNVSDGVSNYRLRSTGKR